jgi:hypothetical protein
MLAAQTTEPKAARSVHLFYQAPGATLFYNEVTVEESVANSYFQVCGFKHGYFGIQEHMQGPDRVLFSVWDPGKQDNPDSVEKDRRVEVLFHADDVTVGRFGNEGTGGQSFFAYKWKIGETYRFLVSAAPEGDKTSFAAYFYLNEEKRWKHLATFRTITGGAALSGYYSFIEDFRRDGKSPHERHRARFGNGWVKLAGSGEWFPLLDAVFSADKTPLNNVDAGFVLHPRADRPGALDTEFYLATGGGTVKRTEIGSTVKRTGVVGARPPEDLPAIRF